MTDMKTEQIERHVTGRCGAQPLEVRLAKGQVRYMVSRRDGSRQLLLHDSEGRCWATTDNSLAWYALDEDPEATPQVWELLNGWRMGGEQLERRAQWDLTPDPR